MATNEFIFIPFPKLKLPAMDPNTDPPPIYHQIPSGSQRKRKGKGTFVKVSASTSTQKMSNYRIRKLADGRLGQQRADRIVVRNTIPEHSSVPDGDVEMSDAHGVTDHVLTNEPLAGKGKEKKKEKRKAKPDTWAVCPSLSLIPYSWLT